ncbi:MAG TPA: SDR family oxidoreductase [Myxococcales bacterium]|nr:SDR family oxidoreductase [Myxococcales bacterium]
MILVTGATGNIGSEVVRQLAAKGQKVRAFVRNPDKAAALKGPNVEIAKGELGKPDTIRPAMQGVDHVFLLSAGLETIAQEEKNVVDEAKKAGVKHIVKLSVMGADMEPGIALGKAHRASEKNVEASGITWTFLRPSGFMSNLFNNADSIKSQGKWYAPYGDGKMGVIDPADIAAVAVKALTERGHEGKAYLLTGSEALSQAEMAQKLGAAVGKKIEYVNVPPEAAADSMLKMGMSKSLVDALGEFSGVVRQGFAAAVSPDTERVLGRKPKSFDQWAKENAAAFK